MSGRRKPYTELGIGRVPCARCGKPSVHQWQVCANGNLHLGCCIRCDLELNRMVLEFFKISGRTSLMRKYKQSQ